MGADGLGRGLGAPRQAASGTGLGGGGLGSRPRPARVRVPGLVASGLSQRGTWPLLVGREGGEPGMGL